MMRRIRNRKEAGQALVLTATGLIALIAITGLAIDAGMMRYEKRLQQNAADAAAIAAAQNLAFHSGIFEAGYAAATKNGYADGGGNAVTNCNASASVGTVCVQVNNPPKAGPHTGNSNYVEALVSRVNPTYFMRVLGVDNVSFTARAVATNISGGANNGCIYTLGQPTKKIEAGISTNGSVVLNGPTCGIVDNGDFTAGGSANLNVTAGSIAVSGSYTQNGCPAKNCITPQPVEGVPASGDPLSHLNLKDPSYVCKGSPDLNLKNTVVVSPGTYNDIKVNASANVTFQSGTYIVCGTMSDKGNAVVSGNGVTFYVAPVSGTVNMNGDSTVDLSAPTSGDYAGILFYQPSTNTNLAKVNGNNSSNFTGTLYFPGADLDFGGTSNGGVFNSGADYTLIVAYSLSLSGNPTITLNSDYSGLPNGQSIITHAILVE
jgi:hypothetical protein